MIAVLDTEDAFFALEPEWWGLWRACPGATPFQSPAWLLPWWRCFGTGVTRVAILRDAAGVLAALLPMYLLEEPGGAKLLPMGAGTTDYLDALGGPLPPLVAALMDRARRDGADGLDLFDIPPWSALLAVQAPWSAGTPCPVLTLPDIPAGMRRKLRMSRHRAARAGGAATEVASAETLPELLPELIRLHQARWTARGEPGTLCDPAVLRFHHEAAPALLEAGLLRLQVLRMGGAVVAAIMALLDGTERILFYLSGFDGAQSFVSPGTILLGEMLEAAIAEGRREAHFLRGREGYKYAWGGIDRPNMSVRLR